MGSVNLLKTDALSQFFFQFFSSFFPVFNGSKFLAGIRNLTVFGPPCAWASVTMIICEKYKFVT